MPNVFGAELRRVENREYQGKPAVAAVLVRTYDTTVEDLWEALTTPARLARWFLPVEGDLKVGGRYQLENHAGGTITRCDRPHAFDLTWESMGATSFVTVRVSAAGDSKAKLVLEHIAHKEGPGEEHFKKYGPGAVGVGWDLTLHGLQLHLGAPDVTMDPAAFEAWTVSPEGKALVRQSGEDWAVAQAASGVDPAEARAQADRTIAFFTGEA